MKPALLLIAVVAALFVFYLGVELRQNHEPGFPLDDPWIHLTFSRNLARGAGFGLNPHEPVAGSTAPLWTLLLTLPSLLFAGPVAMVIIAKAMAAAFLALAAFFALRIGTHLTNSRWSGLGCGLAVATLAPMGWAIMSGMEVTLSAALTLAAIDQYLRHTEGWRAAAGWVLAGIAAWARPECMLLGCFFVLDTAIRRIAFRKPVMFWRGLLSWSVALAPLFALNMVLSGSPLPQTYSAKVGATGMLAALGGHNWAQVRGLLLRAGPDYFLGFLVHVWKANPMLVLLLPLGLAFAVLRAVRTRTSLLLPLLVLLNAPLLGVLAPVGGPAYQGGRYIGNLTAIAALVAFLGFPLVAALLRNRPARALVLGLVLAPTLSNAVVANIATARNTAAAASSINRMQVALGRWLGDNTPAGATVATGDIGAISFFSGRRVIDLVGIANPEALAARRRSGSSRAYIERVRPDLLVIFPASFPEMRDAPYLKAVVYAEVPDNTASEYDFPVRARVLAGLLLLDLKVAPRASTMVVFRCGWPAAAGRGHASLGEPASQALPAGARPALVQA